MRKKLVAEFPSISRLNKDGGVLVTKTVIHSSLGHARDAGTYSCQAAIMGCRHVQTSHDLTKLSVIPVERLLIRVQCQSEFQLFRPNRLQWGAYSVPSCPLHGFMGAIPVWKRREGREGRGREGNRGREGRRGGIRGGRARRDGTPHFCKHMQPLTVAHNLYVPLCPFLLRSVELIS